MDAAPPAEALFARIGRLTVDGDYLRNRLAATERALKEMDAEVVRLRPLEAEVSRLKESVQDLEEVNKVLKESVGKRDAILTSTGLISAPTVDWGSVQIAAQPPSPDTHSE